MKKRHSKKSGNLNDVHIGVVSVTEENQAELIERLRNEALNDTPQFLARLLISFTPGAKEKPHPSLLHIPTKKLEAFRRLERGELTHTIRTLTRESTSSPRVISEIPEPEVPVGDATQRLVRNFNDLMKYGASSTEGIVKEGIVNEKELNRLLQDLRVDFHSVTGSAKIGDACVNIPLITHTVRELQGREAHRGAAFSDDIHYIHYKGGLENERRLRFGGSRKAFSEHYDLVPTYRDYLIAKGRSLAIEGAQLAYSDPKEGFLAAYNDCVTYSDHPQISIRIMDRNNCAHLIYAMMGENGIGWDRLDPSDPDKALRLIVGTVVNDAKESAERIARIREQVPGHYENPVPGRYLPELKPIFDTSETRQLVSDFVRHVESRMASAQFTDEMNSRLSGAKACYDNLRDELERIKVNEFRGDYDKFMGFIGGRKETIVKKLQELAVGEVHTHCQLLERNDLSSEEARKSAQVICSAMVNNNLKWTDLFQGDAQINKDFVTSLVRKHDGITLEKYDVFEPPAASADRIAQEAGNRARAQELLESASSAADYTTYVKCMEEARNCFKENLFATKDEQLMALLPGPKQYELNRHGSELALAAMAERKEAAELPLTANLPAMPVTLSTTKKSPSTASAGLSESLPDHKAEDGMPATSQAPINTTIPKPMKAVAALGTLPASAALAWALLHGNSKPADLHPKSEFVEMTSNPRPADVKSAKVRQLPEFSSPKITEQKPAASIALTNTSAIRPTKSSQVNERQAEEDAQKATDSSFKKYENQYNGLARGETLPMGPFANELKKRLERIADTDSVPASDRDKFMQKGVRSFTEKVQQYLDQSTPGKG